MAEFNDKSPSAFITILASVPLASVVERIVAPSAATAILKKSSSAPAPSYNFKIPLLSNFPNSAPPSGNVEIMISVCFNAGSGGAGDLYAGLSTANATSGYAQLADFHEEELLDQSGRYGRDIVQNYWT